MAKVRPMLSLFYSFELKPVCPIAERVAGRSQWAVVISQAFGADVTVSSSLAHSSPPRYIRLKDPQQGMQWSEGRASKSSIPHIYSHSFSDLTTANHPNSKRVSKSKKTLFGKLCTDTISSCEWVYVLMCYIPPSWKIRSMSWLTTE